MRFKVSSRVSPAATQPGRSGTWALNPVLVGSRRIAYRMRFPSGQARLTQDALLGFGVQFEGRLTCDGYGSGLSRMVELAMTSPLPDQDPAIFLNQPDRFSDRQRHV